MAADLIVEKVNARRRQVITGYSFSFIFPSAHLLFKITPLERQTFIAERTHAISKTATQINDDQIIMIDDFILLRNGSLTVKKL